MNGPTWNLACLWYEAKHVLLCHLQENVEAKSQNLFQSPEKISIVRVFTTRSFEFEVFGISSNPEHFHKRLFCWFDQIYQKTQNFTYNLQPKMSMLLGNIKENGYFAYLCMVYVQLCQEPIKPRMVNCSVITFEMISCLLCDGTLLHSQCNKYCVHYSNYLF